MFLGSEVTTVFFYYSQTGLHWANNKVNICWSLVLLGTMLCGLYEIPLSRFPQIYSKGLYCDCLHFTIWETETWEIDIVVEGVNTVSYTVKAISETTVSYRQ